MNDKNENMIAAAIAELRRLSSAGCAITRDQYEARRSSTAPSFRTVRERAGISWQELVRRAGLQRPAAVRAWATQPMPPALDAEIADAIADAETAQNASGLTVLESSRRVREFYVRQSDGTVRRIVQESVSLR